MIGIKFTVEFDHGNIDYIIANSNWTKSGAKAEIIALCKGESCSEEITEGAHRWFEDKWVTKIKVVSLKY